MAAKSNQVRIIGGEWRSRRISFPDHEGLRPSADRVRETLFNWLGQTLHGRTCLDLFAGSGALGFEALSRGADKVEMVERDRAAFHALKENAEKLKAGNLDLVRADGLSFLRSDASTYDVIFLDPPFRKAYLPDLLPLLPDRLKEGGMVYAESDGRPEIGEDWEVWRQGRAGSVSYQLLKRRT